MEWVDVDPALITPTPQSCQFHLHRLRDLNQTIDQVFEQLQKHGREDLLDSLCPYFGVIWPSARVLASQVLSAALKDPSKFKNLTLLEIGCGLALPSILASIHGAEVIATDYHPDVPIFLNENSRINKLQTLRYLLLDWGHALKQGVLPDFSKAVHCGKLIPKSNEVAERGFHIDSTEGPLRAVDLLIGSDILYEQKHAIEVAETLKLLLEKHSIKEAWITDPARPYLQNFIHELKKRNLKTEIEVFTARDLPVAKEVFFIRIQN